jgi:hypothetical protein
MRKIASVTFAVAVAFAPFTISTAVATSANGDACDIYLKANDSQAWTQCEKGLGPAKGMTPYQLHQCCAAGTCATGGIDPGNYKDIQCNPMVPLGPNDEGPGY